MRATIIIGGLCWMSQLAAVAHAQTVASPAPSPDAARTTLIYAPFSNLRRGAHNAGPRRGFARDHVPAR